MNILIVGNGFDLSHYLPTKYDHFMVAMKAIEEHTEPQQPISFNQLFESLYEDEESFFSYTHAIYAIEQVNLSENQIKEFKEKLLSNHWYRYFKNYKADLQTWIDLECHIEKALEIVSDFIDRTEALLKVKDRIELTFDNLDSKRSNILKVHREHEHILFLLGLFIIAEKVKNDTRIQWQKIENQMGGHLIGEKYHCIINTDFILTTFSYMKLDSKKIIDFLYKELEEFINIFNDYINNIINKLLGCRKAKLTNYFDIDYVYSFNYTQTYNSIYDNKIKVNFLHGSSRSDQNIVLGISDLKDDLLIKNKAYGFVKYHQKLLKNTDFRFLKNNEKLKAVRGFWGDIGKGVDSFPEDFLVKIDKRCNIYLWGHSLDKSDASYIQEIFSYNSEFDENIRVVVLYFNEAAKFSLLANLLDILGKNLVEKWMKEGWLAFKSNPDIAGINNIKKVNINKKFNEKEKVSNWWEPI
ncbi:AbiH family protein [Acinetobacter schindleri]|uniref:AbiH family protein n=1 Tax=Acinetobacter schindleri TaxID=108981 RepID=UPI003F552C56